MTEANGQLRDLLDYIKSSRGFDFSGYKKTTLGRRIEKRMHAVGASSFPEYQDHLQANPREFTELFNTVLINVTSFFRDPPAWEHIADEVIPSLLESQTGHPLRIWSAGCASGEEAYTVAMLLAEAMGIDQFKARVKIYATDLDDDALTTARQAVYSADAVKAVPDPLVEKYFEMSTRGFSFRPDLRRSVIFGRNDLVIDAPISRVDLLLCRNVLMYFTPDAQSQILERFNFALNRSGVLFLGKSEMLISHSDLFAPLDIKWRLFRKVPRYHPRDRLAFAPLGAEDDFQAGLGIRAAAASVSPVAQIIVDRRGLLIEANQRAREAFELIEGDIGKPFHDTALSYRPTDIRSAIDRAYDERTPIRLEDVSWTDDDGDDRVLEIEIAPVLSSESEQLGVAISFVDVTKRARLTEDFEQSRRELETAYEELQSTVEELETTNEELQSTNEELETTNEELQSTNEELETMNEELQSTNDELETMNNEVNTRAVELDRLNLFFEGILGALHVGVVVIDPSHKVQIWNAMATELWGLRPDEVEGSDFLALDIGLPVRQLEDAVARGFGGTNNLIEERVSAVTRRGKQIDVVVRVIPLRTRAGDVYASMILTAPVEG